MEVRRVYGIARDPIPLDSGDEVTRQFQVFHHGVGDMVGNPILIGPKLRVIYLLVWSGASVQSRGWRGAPFA
jgi:hypothetical protein